MSVSDWIIWGGKWRGSLTFIKLSIPYVSNVPHSPAWSYLVTRWQYLCICSNLATQNCWPQQAADHLLLSPVCHHSQHFITPWPYSWDTFTIYSPHINACKLIYVQSVFINILRNISTSTICSNVFGNYCVPPHRLQWHLRSRHISILTHQHILLFNLSTGLPFLIFALCNVQG